MKTVREVIAQLQQFDPEYPVMIEDVDGSGKFYPFPAFRLEVRGDESDLDFIENDCCDELGKRIPTPTHMVVI